MGNQVSKEQRRSVAVEEKLNDSGKRLTVVSRLPGHEDNEIRDGKNENENIEYRLGGDRPRKDTGKGESRKGEVLGDRGAEILGRSMVHVGTKREKNTTEDNSECIMKEIGHRVDSRIGGSRTSERRSGVGCGIRKTSVTLNFLGRGDEGTEDKQKKKKRGGRSEHVRDGRDRDRGAVVEEKRDRKDGALGQGRDGEEERGEGVATLTQDDYLKLLKCLKIKLPKGVVTQRVVELANDKSSIQDAKVILPELENFLISFKVVPRLPCTEVKHYLNLKMEGQILQITKLLFFDKELDAEKCKKQWRNNKENTSWGFRLKDKYMDGTLAISTPALYSTAVTRSMYKLEVGEYSPIVTEGTRVNLADIEGKDYINESGLWENDRLPGRGQFGMFSKNPRDELEMLKFFHESRMLKKSVAYRKGNKVEYGFLTGRLDFLAQIKLNKSSKKSKPAANSFQKLVIECKGTTGDMVGKLFTKIPNSVKIHQSHKYCSQVQAYMYILNKDAEVKKFPQMKRAVMVVRHYHQGGTPARDIHWKYLQIEPSVQEKIDGLRVLCQEEVLARYLALLNLIFQKET